MARSSIHLSPGGVMKARPGFAVVSAVESEILPLDEVLAVGDAPFQRKREVRIDELVDGAHELAIASHDLPFLRKICDLALWLHGGRVAGFGEADRASGAYEASLWP